MFKWLNMPVTVVSSSYGCWGIALAVYLVFCLHKGRTCVDVLHITTRVNPFWPEG